MSEINPRLISFTISSSPNGAAIFINGTNSGFTTPYVLKYTEKELLMPKTILVKNGSATSGETYIISSELVTQTSNGTNPPNQGGSTPVGQGGTTPIIPVRATGSANP